MLGDRHALHVRFLGLSPSIYEGMRRNVGSICARPAASPRN